MINDEAFYAMMPDAIGWVNYRWNGKGNAMTAQEEQDFIDNYTREAMHVLVNKARYSNENILPPDITFFNARQAARDILNRMGPAIEMRKTDLQVGNQECLSYVYKLQTQPEFRGWVNPGLINLYCKVTSELLKSSK